MSHGTVFWANWTPICFMLLRKSCREIIKNFSILPLAGEYLFSAIFFILYDNEKFVMNSDVHNICKRLPCAKE